MILADYAYALDPVLWAEKRLGVSLDPWQKIVLRCVDKQLLLCCTRQAGKSLIAAALGTHMALYTPGSLVLILAPAKRQSNELFRYVMQLYDGSIVAESETTSQLELSNGSRIVCLPGTEKTVRSYSNVSLLIVDEASRTEDVLMVAVRPMLAVSGGRIIAASTPFGKQGWWYKEWAGPATRWKRIMITADQCPRITAAFIQEERDTVGSWFVDQEYFCEFKDASDAYFSEADIMAAFSDEVQPLYAKEN